MAPQAEVEKNKEIIEVVSCFKYLGSCYSLDEGLQDNAEVRKAEIW